MLVEGEHFMLEDAFDGDRIAGKKGELQLMYFINGIIDELLASDQYDAWYTMYEQRAAQLGM